jgi:dihydropteroate synthase
MLLHCADKTLDLSRTHVMGVLNVTPDSFSDGGEFLDPQQAVAHAWQMVEEGASIVDIGGESTRPGALDVSVDDELARVIPVIEGLRAADIPVPISIDTSKPEVMARAVQAGAGLINDVRALRADGALAAARESGVPVCLMHMQGKPRTMQEDPHYADVVEEVYRFLAERMAACESAGIERAQLLLDPGFGFGKTLEHNLSLLKHLDRFAALGQPLLIGLSRKRMIGQLLDAEVGDRVHGSVAGAVVASWLGARIVRVHDVRATVDALKVCDAVRSAS